MATARKGVVFKRCWCPDPVTGRRGGRTCPMLAERSHGTWYFGCSVSDLWGRRRQFRRGGFASKAAATRARDAVLAQSCEQTTAHLWTLETWLGFWLSTRRSIRPSTARTYRTHIDRYLVPALGQVRLAELTGRDIARMFAVLAATHNRHGRLYSAAMLQRIRATLRAALNAAICEGLIRDNPARRVELANPRRPHPVVWTDRRVTDWQRTGERPAVAVWTAIQLAYFLSVAREERLYPLWWLIALRGLRRGEACGLRWADVDLEQHCLTVAQQITYIDGQLVVAEPKSRASRRVVALDPATVQILHAQARRQRADAATAGASWHDTGYVFTRPNGTPLRPDSVTQRTRHLIGRTGLPPVRLHDLRHGAASLAHAAGADLKTVQDQLGHASIVLTADTYTSVLDTVQHAAARNTAQLVLCAARKLGTDLRHQRPTPGPTTATPPTLTTAGPPNRPSPAKTPRRTKKAKARTQRAQSKKCLHRKRSIAFDCPLSRAEAVTRSQCVPHSSVAYVQVRAIVYRGLVEI